MSFAALVVSLIALVAALVVAWRTERRERRRERREERRELRDEATAAQQRRARPGVTAGPIGGGPTAPAIEHE
jgi:FtsZ-interacting cell division protein ZipA